MQIPAAAITHGAVVNGTHTEPDTFILYNLLNGYEASEGERIMMSGAAILDFRHVPNETIDIRLVRFDLARQETESVGAGMDLQISLAANWTSILSAER